MDFFSVLALLGGLAIFLYGMNLMGDGLAKVAGGKLERILETLTSNPIENSFQLCTKKEYYDSLIPSEPFFLEWV